MNILPIQIIDNKVVIPLQYFDFSKDLEITFENDFAVIGAKEVNDHTAQVNGHTSDDEKMDMVKLKERFPWIGMAESRDPTASSRVKEILMAEVDLHSGWTTKPSLED